MRRLPSFHDLFGAAPAATGEAPGRVNLIGEHTDYNGGFVLPAAIPQATRVELTPTADSAVRVWSAAFSESPAVEYQLGAESRDGSWSDYVKGMTQVLSRFGLAAGFRARVVSDVPLGSGLSSSAALEIALGRAIRQAFDLKLNDLELAHAAREAEHHFVGAPVGIMDQLACSLATPQSALFLDTRTLAYETIPLPPGSALVVIDSGIPHRHAGGGYVERRRECQEASALLGVRELRDVVSPSAVETRLPPVLARRVRHVVSENGRVLQTVDAIRRADLRRVGELFHESHVSLRDDFEVSVPAIDALVEIAMRTRGIYGARLTGGGFGGSIVAFAAANRAADAAAEIAAAYATTTGRRPAVVVPIRQ